MLFLVVALLSLIGTVYSADCSTYLALTITPCLITSSPCDCWKAFLENQQSECTAEQSVAIFAACKPGCADAFFNCTAADCLSANLIFTTCAAYLAPGKTACDCFKNYKENTNGKCVSKDEQLTEVAQCAIARGLCPDETCNLACELLDDLIPDTEQTFQTCWTNNADKCACYSATVDKIADFDGCNPAATLKLQTCVQTQLDCQTLQDDGGCDTSEVTLSIDTIKELVDANVEKFRNAWNSFLSKLAYAISIDTVTQETDGNTITFTITITHDNDVQTAINDCIHVFSLTIGLKAEDMHGKEVQTTKRGVLSTSTVEITGNGSGTSGASGLTIMLLPINPPTLFCISHVFLFFFYLSFFFFFSFFKYQ
jgi:hypothetical protein